ncbi:uncharacterized protein LOC127715361 [Mytilus californianus]|uniref:uncharacterized protein LOC127715361 n=1 Tax=Mytilus californianus TaxID=6549 RepID=UPI002247F712|nr:uncharacterized protein LOC127715361 [Mytilus californianus]
MMQKRHWKVMCILALSILLLQQRQCNGFQLRCPYSSEWNIRATQTCGNLSKYYCLWDDYRKEYNESCRDKPELWLEGTKCVIRQNLDSEDCTFERFQPFTFSTEGYSDCIYSKSACEDKGFVNHNNGSATDDRNCRCDYNNGYAFVLKPRHNYFCIPSQEDCSCYQHRCEESFRLTAEYNCTKGAMDRSSMKERLPSTEKSDFSGIGSILQTETTYRIDRDYLTNVFRDGARVLVLLGTITAIGCIVFILLYTFGQPECFMEHELYRSSKDEEVILQCRIISYLPIKLVSWSNKSTNEILVNDERYTIMEKSPFSLVIRQAKANYSGLYECTLKSCVFGTFVCPTQLKVESNSVFNILPSYFPGTEDTILLACRIPSVPFEVKSTIWKRQINNEVVNIVSATKWKEKYSVISEPPSLKIMNSNTDDTGKYICLLSNGVEQMITSIVIDSPDVVPEEKNIYTLPGETKTLKYYIKSTLAVRKLLQKQKDDVNTDDVIPTEEEDTYMSYTIDQTVVEDAGTYICIVSNSLGTKRLSTRLYVGERPEIITRQTSFNIPWGKDVILHSEVHCALTKLAWEKSIGENISPIDTENTSKYGGGTIECPTLTIKNADVLDEGLYTCYATNDMGTTQSATISLTVERSTNQQDVSIKSEMSELYLTLQEENGTENDECNADASDGFPSSAQVVLLGVDAKEARRKARKFLEEETRIVLVGKTGVGKSSTANTLLGRRFFQAGDDPTPVTEKCMTAKGTWGHKPFLLIDTPGIFAINEKEKETELEIKRCIHLAAPGPHAILFIIEFGRIRQDDFESIKTFLKYFGEKLKQFVIIVFTHADKVKEYQTLETWLQKVPELQRFLDECGRHYCLMNNEANERDKEQYIMCLMNAIEAVKLKNGLLHYTDDAIMKAERRVQGKERIIEEKIRQEHQREVDEKMKNVIQFTQGSSENLAVISIEQRDRELNELHYYYQKRLEVVREEARDECLLAYEEFKEFFFQRKKERK